MDSLHLKLKKKKHRDKEQPTKKKFKGSGLRIVDDSDDFSFGPSNRRNLYSTKSELDKYSKFDDDDDEGHNDVEDLPQIAGVVDERPLLVQAKERFSTANKWKQLGGDEETREEKASKILETLNNSMSDKNSRIESESTNFKSHERKTLDGKRAGLQRASALREEMVAHRKRENEVFAKMDDTISGKNAETKVRDRRSAKEREEDAKKKAEEEKFNKERKEKYDKWGKGLTQVKGQEEKVGEALHEMSKPLARYKDDEDLDAHLRAQERDGDPMLAMLTKKKSKRDGGPPKPKYIGPQPAPNRFKIPPGYRWDGVDRSNGYEKEWFNRINSKKALQEESYKWSVEDL